MKNSFKGLNYTRRDFPNKKVKENFKNLQTYTIL